MSLKILQYPHKDLKKIIEPTLLFDDALRQSIAQMFETMYSIKTWGLAASQVGLSLRAFVMDISANQDTPQCFINPEIITIQDKIESEEDCISLPGVSINVLRAREIQVKYQNEQGEEQILPAKDIAACCIQYLLDHLNGILLIDHLSKLKRDRLLKKYLKGGFEHHGCGNHHCHHDHA